MRCSPHTHARAANLIGNRVVVVAGRAGKTSSAGGVARFQWRPRPVLGLRWRSARRKWASTSCSFLTSRSSTQPLTPAARHSRLVLPVLMLNFVHHLRGSRCVSGGRYTSPVTASEALAEQAGLGAALGSGPSCLAER